MAWYEKNQVAVTLYTLLSIQRFTANEVII